MMEKVRDKIDLAQLAQHLQGELHGNSVAIKDVAGIDDVKQGEITWVENEKAFKQASKTKASALIISRKIFRKHSDEIKVPFIVTDNPRFAYARTLALFYKRKLPPRGVAKTAVIGQNVKIGKDVAIGDFAYVGDNAVIDDGVTLFPHTYLGRNVTIGENSIIFPFATIYDNCKLGSEVIIHSGAVIGADGFGFVKVNGRQAKIPQVGVVHVGDNVEIGANTTVDRATTGVTSIGDGTKIDNLVQIGHNSKLGKNCIMVSHSGIAGSTVLGDNVTLAAQAGTAPHIKIGSNTIVAGRGGVNHDIPPNSAVSGFPAKPHREALKIQAAMQRLPFTMKTVKELEKRLEKLENKINKLSSTNEEQV